jgi:type I restriction enzyme S subunit
VEWIGEIPAHWEVCSLRRKLKNGPDGIKIGPFGSQLKLEYMKDSGYKVYGQENVIVGDFGLGSEYVGEEKFSELAACSIQPGDVVVTMMGTTGRCRLVPPGIAPGVMDSHLLRLRIRETELTPAFAARLIDDAYYVREQLKASGKGAIMHGLNSSLIKIILLGLPPIPEQRSILDFLDHETAQIDALISKKERLLELLTEKRTALISHAVTKGLDPTVPMKDSGVEWIGEIPAHWTALPNGFLFRERDERGFPDLPLLNVSIHTGVSI